MDRDRERREQDSEQPHELHLHEEGVLREEDVTLADRLDDRVSEADELPPGPPAADE